MAGWMEKIPVSDNSFCGTVLLLTTTDAGDGWLQFLPPHLFVRRVDLEESLHFPRGGVKKTPSFFSGKKKMESDFEPRARNGFRSQIKD